MNARDPVAVAFDDAQRCPARALDSRGAELTAPRLRSRPRWARAAGRGASREARSDCSSSRWRCSRRPCTSPRARVWIAGTKASYASSGLAARASSSSPDARAAGPVAPRRRASRERTTPTPGSRSWNERLKRSSRQPEDASRPQLAELAPRSPDRAFVQSEPAAPDAHASEQEAVPGELRVQPACALGQAGEALRSCGETGAGAYRRDVVQVAPDPLELEEHGASPRELAAGAVPE